MKEAVGAEWPVLSRVPKFEQVGMCDGCGLAAPLDMGRRYAHCQVCSDKIKEHFRALKQAMREKGLRCPENRGARFGATFWKRDETGWGTTTGCGYYISETPQQAICEAARDGIRNGAKLLRLDGQPLGPRDLYCVDIFRSRHARRLMKSYSRDEWWEQPQLNYDEDRFGAIPDYVREYLAEDLGYYGAWVQRPAIEIPVPDWWYMLKFDCRRFVKKWMKFGRLLMERPGRWKMRNEYRLVTRLRSTGWEPILFTEITKGDRFRLRDISPGIIYEDGRTDYIALSDAEQVPGEIGNYRVDFRKA